ncbi:helix-turn-helix domain-containing protein [Campylobacter geochelonis]|uniref:helix-turn-helix domain-containing protein n=1 Tax=Campylobacter geochelonis TaxID=1780362 RepID=UPI0007707522|nr:hypothetical protein [Campylobacter geochelonis]CZE46608.1 phosphatidylglycerophosphate synthase [Campylobacter geochelonis]CZE50394.1 phosphatidylglycerophosphate synthase [Campylobacter geochelonis]
MDENVIKNPLKRIEEIGVREVSKATHIETEYIEYILDKNYEKLVGKNAKGFIKIIEREYGLNLQEWLDEYNAFRGENSRDDGKVFANSVTQNEIVIKDHKKAPSFLLWFVILIILAWAVYYFKLYDLTAKFLSTVGEQNSSISYTNATIVEKVENKLENVGVTIPLENASHLNANITTKDENKTEPNVLEKTIMLETNSTLQDDENATKQLNLDDEKSGEQTAASIIPSEKMWIGIIDVKTGKKTTMITTKKYDIDLEKEQLVLTGHGFFKLDSGDKNEQFKDKNPTRLYIKDGKISQISYDEFLKLNKGKAW